jgi:membrane associated rhomboid family serine protease
VRIFLFGLLLGGVSGGVTQHYTGDPQLAASVGIVAAVATWLGVATVIFCFEPE